MNELELAARMRQAYTQATVAFPRTLNALPIANEVYRIFDQVHEELSTDRSRKIRAFDPLEPSMVKVMSALVLKAADEIRCRTVPAEVTRGMSPQMAKQFGALVTGLDIISARQLLLYAQTRGVKPDDVKARRYVLLSSRRNLCANRIAHDAVLDAREYFLSGGTDEPDSG